MNIMIVERTIQMGPCKAHFSVRCSHKGVRLEHFNERYLDFQQSKPHPNAVTRTKAKGHVT
jgi:hypothetical protein